MIYTAKEYFNSIKVRLERRNPRPADHLNVYFNSIKVRLEPEIPVLLII